MALAALLAGCEEDAASPRPGGPRLVAVLGAGSERATGFAVDPGRVVTVAHALDGGTVVRVRTGSGARRARVLRVDRRADLALLAVRGLKAGASRTTTAGPDEDVHVLVLRGSGRTARPATVRRAIVARVGAPGPGRPVRRPALELEARTLAGDSGAPVVSEGGEVAGVVFARSHKRADTAYAVSAQALDRLLDGAGGGQAPHPPG